MIEILEETTKEPISLMGRRQESAGERTLRTLREITRGGLSASGRVIIG